MEVKPGSSVYIIDDVVSGDFCQTIKTIIDNTNGHIEKYKPGSNVRAKSITKSRFENKKFAMMIDNEINPYIAPINSDSGYNLRKIHGATREHVDGSVCPDKGDPSVRKFSLIIALNGDYEGGEFCFPHQDIKVKLKKCQAILFPPFWTHPHSTNELLNDTFRYTISTWLLE
jgi:hypothetical protein